MVRIGDGGRLRQLDLVWVIIHKERENAAGSVWESPLAQLFFTSRESCGSVLLTHTHHHILCNRLLSKHPLYSTFRTVLVLPDLCCAYNKSDCSVM